jgi:hypothetical protein
MDALKEARGEANRVREESVANEFADRMDIQDKYKSAAEYSKNPTEENKARALEMGNAPSQLANLRESSGAPMTKPERDRQIAKIAQDFMRPGWMTAADAVAKATEMYDIIYSQEGSTPKPVVDEDKKTGDGEISKEDFQNMGKGDASVADDMEPGSVDKIMKYLGEAYNTTRGSGFKSTVDALQGIAQSGITTTDHRDMYRPQPVEPLPSSGMFMLKNPNQR